MGIFNTKDWQTRLTEIKNTIRTNTTRQVALAKLDQKLNQLTPNQQKAFSNSLHLNVSNTDKTKRDLVRAVMFLDILVFGDVRSHALTNRYVNEPNIMLTTRIDTLLFALEPSGGADLGKYRPIRPGISISGGNHPGPGSIGCFVTCNQTNRPMLLSNEHVLRAEFGTGQPANNLPVLQPAKGGTGMIQDKIATYARGILDARMDAAVAYLEQGIQTTDVLRCGLAMQNAGPMPAVGDVVFKQGATSGLTVGEVVSISHTATVPHAKFGGNITFTNQIDVHPIKQLNDNFQIPGDSGSALLDGQFRVIGLMHGGGQGGIATPIATVIAALNVRF
jgi:hypothetical protein